MQTSAARSRTLRFRLFLLAATGLVPLTLVLVLSTFYLASERSTTTQRNALELSRAIATAVDAELQSTVALLQSLTIATRMPDMEADQLSGERFSALAREVVERQGWRTLLVTDARGSVLMRALDTGARASVTVEPDSVAQVISTRQPVVGRVARGPQGRDGFAVRIPVLRGSQLRYVLTAVVSTDRVLAVVTRQRLAPEWVVAVFDQLGFRVARSIATTVPRLSPSLEALVQANGNEGMGMTYTIEGIRSHTGFSRVAASQWTVAVGIPVREADADLRHLLAAVAAGALASLAVMAALAWRTARSISGPVDTLRKAAGALGVGQPVELPALGMDELDAVGLALRQASDERGQAQARGAQAQAEREQLLAKLEEALRRAEQVNRGKDEFLALLGHELRNPLAPIANALHLMHLKGDPATAHERTVIQRQLTYVTRLVDDLLDASRITSQRFVIHLRSLRPVPVLEQTVESVRPMLNGRTLRLAVDDAARQLWVRADEARLVQVFNNLLGNALKFTESGGTLDVSVRADAGAIVFVFRDDGAGMAPAELGHAFDLFYQAASGARQAKGGLGLGLSIVRSLIEMHGGSVQAASAGLGQGTTVTVRLPSTAAPAAEKALTAPSARFQSTRVLVVDDNVDAADTLATVLRLSGFQVGVAYSSQAALDAVASLAPEIAILDIGLPDMDGYQLAHRLREHSPPFKGRLIALTGYGQEQDVHNAMDAGFDAHLTKPVAPDALLQLMARLLADQTQHRAST